MNIPELLSYLYPNAIWSLHGEDYDGLIWHEGNEIEKPSKQELESAWPDFELQDKVNKLKYAVSNLFTQKAVELGFLSCTDAVSFIDSQVSSLSNLAGAFFAWRDSVINYAIPEYEKFLDKTREIVDTETFLEEVPKLNLEV